MEEELEQTYDGDDAVAAPAPAPEPAAEPEPQPEFDYIPSFLGEEQAAPGYREPAYQDQQWSPQQAQAYNQYMRQQQMPRDQGKSTLERFIQNPDGTISEFAKQEAQQVAQQLMAQTYGPMAAQMQHFVQGQARYHTAVHDARIESLYRDTFTKDETFASNDRVRAHVDNAIQGLRANAIAMAQNGDPSGFQIFNNPTFAEATLAIAKIVSRAKPGSPGSAPVPHVERTAPSTKKEAVELDPDTEAAIGKYGPAFRERYIKELENQAKYNDFVG
jgi:hypothetical protein